MINKLKHIANTKEKKTVLSNFFSLSALQIVTYLFPLITLPYLIRVLGVEKYGLVMFAQSFVLFFNIIVDYGFNLSATKEISINRENKDIIDEVFSSVIFIKAILLLVSFVVLTIVVLNYPKFTQNKEVFFFSFLWVVGQALFPIWYFQGIEKMKYITIVNVIAKSLFTISIFIFIREKSDYILVPILNGLGLVFSGLFSLFFIFFHFKQRFYFNKIKLFKHLKAGFHVFVSSSAFVLLVNSPLFFIGLWLGDTMAGIYSAFDKIVNAGKNLFIVVAQVLFPYMSRLYNENKVKYKKVYIKYLLAITFISIIAIFLVYLLADWFVPFYFGEKFVSYSYIFHILFLVMFIGVISNVLGLNGLLVMGKVKLLSLSQLIPALIFVVCAPWLLKYNIGLNAFLALYVISFVGIVVVRSYSVFNEFKKYKEKNE